MTTIVQLPEAEVNISIACTRPSGAAVRPAPRRTSSKPVANPATNALPAAALLASFIGTGSSFLAFAALAEKRGLTDTALPGKSFYFLGGLTEATETITVFAAMCIWPEHFAVLAYGFAGLCAVTTGMRVGWGYRRLG